MDTKGLIVVICFSILFYTCKKANELDVFYTELAKELTDTDFLVFKNAAVDSALFFFDFFYEEYRLIVKQEILDKEETFLYLKSLELNDDDCPSYAFLIFNFHAYLNDKPSYSWDDCKRMYKEKELSKLKKEAEEKTALLNLILENKKQCKVGDTLAFIFPIYEQHYGKTAGFRAYPYSSSFEENEDTFKLKGVLLKQHLDSFDLQFKLKITDLSHDDVRMLGKKTKLYEQLLLPIKSYGRLIE